MHAYALVGFCLSMAPGLAAAQDVSVTSVNGQNTSARFSISQAGDAFLGTLRTFDTVNIDPNAGQFGQLPVASLPCHQVSQVYVVAQTCLGSQASSSAETYGYSFNMANTDSGTGAPSSGAPGGSGTDKVVVYIGGDQQSSHSNLWGLNEVVWARDGMGGVTGAELDLNRAASCDSKTDLSWIGDTNCPQFIGQWITGLNGGGTGGPAIFITAVGGSKKSLWNDGVAIAGGLAVRDTGFLDASNSNTVMKANGTHSYGVDVYNANITGAAVRLMSGNFYGSVNGQGIFWYPGPASNGSAGGADSITDFGAGLTLSTDNSHIVTLSGGNVLVSAGALFISQNNGSSSLPTPFLQQDATGNLRVGQAGISSGGLNVDGTVTTTNLNVKSAIVFPAVAGNQPLLTTDSTGSLHISGNGTGGSLHIDEPLNPSSVASSGPVTAGTLSSAGTLTYGTGNSSGNHKVVEGTLSVYNLNGNVALTPNGLAESASNNIAVITTGGAKLTADVMCQNQTDSASWIVKATYLTVNGTLTQQGQAITADVAATTGAKSWLIASTVDTANSAPEVVVGLGSGNTVPIDCTAKFELIIVK